MHGRVKIWSNGRLTGDFPLKDITNIPGIETIFNSRVGIESCPVKQVESIVSEEETKPDRDYFKTGVVEHKDAVFAQDDPELHRAYVRACVYVDNLALAYESLTTLMTNPDAKQKELMGLVACEMGNNDAAFDHLREIEPTTCAANTFLGITYFNVTSFQKARRYFHKAVNLGGESEYRLLNLLTDVYASGNQLEANVNARDLVNRRAIRSFSIEQITEQLQRRELPTTKVGEGFYEIAKNLI